MGYGPWSRKGQTWPSYKWVTFLRAPPAPEPPPVPALVPFVNHVPPSHPRASVCPGPLLCCLTAVTAPLCRPQLRDPRALICLPAGSDLPPSWLRAWHSSLLSSLGLAPQTSRRALVLPTRPLPWGPSLRCNARGLPRVPPTCPPANLSPFKGLPVPGIPIPAAAPGHPTGSCLSASSLLWVTHPHPQQAELLRERPPPPTLPDAVPPEPCGAAQGTGQLRERWFYTQT